MMMMKKSLASLLVISLVAICVNATHHLEDIPSTATEDVVSKIVTFFKDEATRLCKATGLDTSYAGLVANIYHRAVEDEWQQHERLRREFQADQARRDQEYNNEDFKTRLKNKISGFLQVLPTNMNDIEALINDGLGTLILLLPAEEPDIIKGLGDKMR